MANHVRQQIREQVGTTLTGLTTTGSRVYQSRVYPLQVDLSPTLLIYTKSEVSEPIVIGSARTTERILTLAVEGYVKATTNSDDTVDTIAKEVETALATDTTLNGLAKDCYLESTEIDYNGEGELPVAVITLNFNVSYMTAENAPDVAV
jgi:hypothetical protein